MSIGDLVHLQDESELIAKLKQDINATDRDTVVFQAGHFPITYEDRPDSNDPKKNAIANLDRWGPFSEYTLQIATQLAAYTKKQGKNVKFLFLADDHSYSSQSNPSSEQSARKRFYQDRSGENASIDDRIQQILQTTTATHAFDKDDVIRHDHGKKGRKACLYFSENILRNPTQEPSIDEEKANELSNIGDSCGREYTTLLQSKYIDEAAHLISFIPDLCHSSVCNKALDQPRLEEDISASHVFIPTQYEKMLTLRDADDLYKDGFGVRYRRDVP